MKLPTRSADPAEHGLYYREVDIDTRGLDEEARTVPARLSTTARVQRFFGFEQLSHAPRSVNLARAKRGLPLLFSHDQQAPIGRVEKISLDGDSLTGTLRFSRNKRAEEVWEDVRAGFLSDVSIGYRVEKWREEAGGRIAERWEVLEASVVAVPADPGATIQRSEEPDMPETQETITEVERLTGITTAFRSFPQYSDLMHTCLEDKAITPERSRQLLLDKLAEGVEAIDSTSPASSSVDVSEKFRGAVNQALTVGWNIRAEPQGQYGSTYNREQRLQAERWDEEYADARKKAGANPYVGMSLTELAREHLVQVSNIPEARSWRKSRVVDEVFKRASGIIGHGRDDFTSLLADNIGKMLQVGYTEAPETFQQWVKIGQLNDFKTANRPNMSTFGDLDDVTNDLEYEYGTFSDRQETIALKTFGKLFSISRTALINDDQNAFSEIPRHMGRAAARMVGDEVYTTILTASSLAGPTMSDGTALFHANHSNLTASGTAPTAAALNTAYTLMARQTDPASNVLNLRAAYIIVPPDLWGTTRTLLTSELVPGGSTNDRNIWQAQLEQVTEARLTDTTNWYLAALASQVGTIEVAYLDGVQAPFLQQEDGLTRDGVTYKVRHDFGAAALDHRGLYRNNGA